MFQIKRCCSVASRNAAPPTDPLLCCPQPAGSSTGCKPCKPPQPTGPTPAAAACKPQPSLAGAAPATATMRLMKTLSSRKLLSRPTPRAGRKITTSPVDGALHSKQGTRGALGLRSRDAGTCRRWAARSPACCGSCNTRQQPAPQPFQRRRAACSACCLLLPRRPCLEKRYVLFSKQGSKDAVDSLLSV